MAGWGREETEEAGRGREAPVPKDLCWGGPETRRSQSQGTPRPSGQLHRPHCPSGHETDERPAAIKADALRSGEAAMPLGAAAAAAGAGKGQQTALDYRLLRHVSASVSL